MRIVCSTNMPFAAEAFGQLGDVEILPPSAITRESVRDADLLCIRSTTRADRALLEGSGVRFVGTATIGTDHMDTGYMDSAGIAWRSAAGCNANSVSEYVAAALLCVARRHGFRLEGRTLGVIGVGRVGRLVVEKARALGMSVLQNDPPRAETEGGDGFLPLDEILASSGLVTLHVPLTRAGRHPTLRLANHVFFGKLRRDSVFINAARGAVTDSDALLEAFAKGNVAHAILDTWEGEPVFRRDVMERVDIGTPHIAGHSFEGKVMGTVILFREACAFLGVQSEWTPDPLLPEPVVPVIHLDVGGMDDEAAMHEIVRRVYDVEADDQRLRASASQDDEVRGKSFEQLRQKYPVRREFRFTRVELANGTPRLREKLTALGFPPDLG